MRSTVPLALTILTALACGGGEDVDPGEQADIGSGPAAGTAPVGEDPGLPTTTTDFRGTSWSTEPGASRIGGQLWVSTATTVEEEGFSLIAAVDSLPEGSYSWALHRGDCTAQDQPLFDLGYGSNAGTGGSVTEIREGQGEAREAPRIFRSAAGGRAEHTVFVPLGEELTAAEVAGSTHSVRLHPNVSGDDPGPSIACAPIPPLPRPGEMDPEQQGTR